MGWPSSKSGEARLALLNLALNAATIRRLTNTWKDGTHGIDEVDAHVRRSEFQSSLDNVVAVRIAHQLLQLIRMHHLLDHRELSVDIGATDTLFNDVRAKLLFGKLGDLAREAHAQRCCEARVIEIENVLHDVVAEGVLHEVERVGRDLAD